MALGLDRPTRRLIQQELRNEGFNPGAPDGLFGPRTRAAFVLLFSSNSSSVNCVAQALSPGLVLYTYRPESMTRVGSKRQFPVSEHQKVL